MITPLVFAFWSALLCGALASFGVLIVRGEIGIYILAATVVLGIRVFSVRRARAHKTWRAIIAGIVLSVGVLTAGTAIIAVWSLLQNRGDPTLHALVGIIATGVVYIYASVWISKRVNAPHSWR